MVYRLKNIKQKSLIRTLRRDARKNNRSPDEIEIYSHKRAKTARGRTVSKDFNSIAISKRISFSVRMYGKPYIHSGFTTKRYDLPTVLKLLQLSYAQFYKWLAKGIMPQPFLRVSYTRYDKIYFLYHQVCPVVVWYAHMKARGIVNIDPRYCQHELLILKRMLAAHEKRFLVRMGIKYEDAYTKAAGRYGVMPIKDDN